MRADVLKISLGLAFSIVVAANEVSAMGDSPYETSKKRVVVSSKSAVVISPSRVVYTSKTPTVKVVRTLPPVASVIKYKGVDIYFYNGVFYRKELDKFICIAAPVGLKIKVLPEGYTVVEISGRNYFYYEGTYYLKSNNEYEVVDAPTDVIVSTLPEEAEHITIDGKDYYLYNGKIYSIVITPDGKAFKMTGEISLDK